MAEYAFQTVWRLRSSVAPIWNAILDSEQWPKWWRGVVSVQKLADGNADGTGSVRRYVWQSRLPYSLTFDMETVRVEPLTLIEGHATGELQGTGVWRFIQSGEVTMVTYDWRVRTTRAWMNLLAPLARPLFAWNHDWVMQRGGEGLATRLGAELLPAGSKV